MVSPSGDATGATDTAALIAAIGAATSGDTVSLSAGAFYGNAAIPMKSGVTVAGAGKASTTWNCVTSAYSNPKFYHKCAAFIFAGTCADDDYSTYYTSSGDWFTTSARPFSASQSIAEGSTSFEANGAGQASDLSVGDWVHVSEGLSAWHPAKSEFVQVASVSGATVNLQTPLQNGYSNTEASLGEFIRQHYLTANPSGEGRPDMSSWENAGFRKVTPIVDAVLRGMTINCNQVAPVERIPWLMQLAVGCSVADVGFTGRFWQLDSQDITVQASGGTYGGTCYVGNGCNQIAVELDLACAFAIEEGAQRVTGSVAAHGFSTIQQFCRDVALAVTADNAEGAPALQVGICRGTRIRPTLSAVNAGLYLTTPRLAAIGAAAKFRTSEIWKYFDLGNPHLVGGSCVSSASPSYSWHAVNEVYPVLFGTSVPAQQSAPPALCLVSV